MPSFRKGYKRPWSAQVNVAREKKTYHLGYFDTKEEAIEAEAEFRKTKQMPGKGWPEHARQKSKAVRAEKKVENATKRSGSLGVRMANTRWKKPDPMPVGESKEVLQERARLRAAASIRD